MSRWMCPKCRKLGFRLVSCPICPYCKTAYTTEAASQTGLVGKQHNDDRVDAKINDSLETELRL